MKRLHLLIIIVICTKFNGNPFSNQKCSFFSLDQSMVLPSSPQTSPSSETQSGKDDSDQCT